jgi:hypothetical protein
LIKRKLGGAEGGCGFEGGEGGEGGDEGGSKGGGGVVQIFQPELSEEWSDDQVIDEAATSLGPVEPLY